MSKTHFKHTKAISFKQLNIHRKLIIPLRDRDTHMILDEQFKSYMHILPLQNKKGLAVRGGRGVKELVGAREATIEYC